MIAREPWENDLQRAVNIARQAELPEVVLAIQNAFWRIHVLKEKADDLQQIKDLLRK